MRARVFHQPFDADGRLCHLGDELNHLLASGRFNDVHIFSAFVTSSGTERIRDGLSAVIRARGRVRTLIGVNNGLTSLQAVADLLSVGAEVRGLHTGGSVLYHPKIFLLRGQQEAWLSVGSSNLTGEGLYRNFEANTFLELDLTQQDDLDVADGVLEWLAHVTEAFPRNAIAIREDQLNDLIADGTLVDEVAMARLARPPEGRGARERPAFPTIPRISVPPLPNRPIAVRRPRAARRAAEVEPAAIPASALRANQETRFFAMILSAHDASKRTGTRGTPELSLPQGAVPFFPRLERTTRMYPDAYFDVLLNSEEQARVVQYRLWERPGGEGAGHADLRINIKHDTVDLSTAGGGDIILFEATPRENGPSYDVWLIKPNDPRYQEILRRCTHRVAARGAGDDKRFGFF